MIKTSIVLGFQDNIPVEYRSTGLAKDLSTAKWLFCLTGWGNSEGQPKLFYETIKVDWPEGNALFKVDNTTLWSLGHKIILN